MSYVWGVAFSKDIGAEKTPRSNGARLVSAVYAFLALVIVNTYCANLMAFLVQDSPILPITGILDKKVRDSYTDEEGVSARTTATKTTTPENNDLIG